MILNNLTYKRGLPSVKSNQSRNDAILAISQLPFSFSTFRQHYIKPSLDKLRKQLGS